MNAERVLEIVCREMCKIGSGWRISWGDFDGRTLRAQLDELDKWAGKALKGETDEEYTGGTEFYEGQNEF